jgi:hypothetical protein
MLKAVPLLLRVLRECKRSLEHVLPFAMDPVVYEWEVNNRGTVCSVVQEMPSLSSSSCNQSTPQSNDISSSASSSSAGGVSVDEELQRETQRQLREGIIGLKQNLLNQTVSNVAFVPFAVLSSINETDDSVAVVVLAGGLGTRWTKANKTKKQNKRTNERN